MLNKNQNRPNQRRNKSAVFPLRGNPMASRPQITNTSIEMGGRMKRARFEERFLRHQKKRRRGRTHEGTLAEGGRVESRAGRASGEQEILPKK